ncbi:mitochondrial import receptor subunit TOM20 [Pseudohyphozyma bogoriensis]|nr:mitochondrial import receptor subunit TOM20 [Pseudohyphozyma bogoriensis]
MSSSSLTAPKIAGIAASVLAVGVVGYAAYFDHKRRHDPAFRAKIHKENKKVQKKSAVAASHGRQAASIQLLEALTLLRLEQVPTDVQSKEAYFMTEVGNGEQLAARGPPFYVASAVCFYKALRVYPAPAELIQIYQKTQPAPVFEYVMELITLDVNQQQAAAARAAPRAAAAAAATASSSYDPRDDHSDALLEEVTPAPSAPAAPESDNGESPSSPSTGSSYVHVEEEKKENEAKFDEVVKEVEETVETVEETVSSEDPAEPAL